MGVRGPHPHGCKGPKNSNLDFIVSRQNAVFLSFQRKSQKGG